MGVKWEVNIIGFTANGINIRVKCSVFILHRQFMSFLMLYIGPGSELFAAYFAGHLLPVSQPLVLGQIRFVA